MKQSVNPAAIHSIVIIRLLSSDIFPNPSTYKILPLEIGLEDFVTFSAALDRLKLIPIKRKIIATTKIFFLPISLTYSIWN